jgi:hypothetical protein
MLNLGAIKFGASKLLITNRFWNRNSINPVYGLYNSIL